MHEQTYKYLKYTQQRSNDLMKSANRQHRKRSTLRLSLALWLNGAAKMLAPELGDSHLAPDAALKRASL